MQHPPLCHIGVGITKLVLLVDPNLVVLLVMVEVGWVLGPPTSPTIKFIFVLMLVVGFLGHLRLILQHIPCCHLRFIVQHPPQLNIGEVTMHLGPLLMDQVLWVIGPPISPPRKPMWAPTHSMGDFSHIGLIFEHNPMHHI